MLGYVLHTPSTEESLTNKSSIGDSSTRDLVTRKSLMGFIDRVFIDKHMIDEVFIDKLMIDEVFIDKGMPNKWMTNMVVVGKGATRRHSHCKSKLPTMHSHKH